MGLYQTDEEITGKERHVSKSRKSPKNGRKFDERESQTVGVKAEFGAMVSGKAIDMLLKPDWDQVEKVRKKARTCLKKHGLSNDLVDALTMVSSELVENGIKYGCFEELGKGLTFSLQFNEKKIIIEVIHPTNSTSAQHLRRLDKTLQWIRGFQDPFQAYVEKLKEVAQRPIRDTESGLGLVRIAYEGKSIIDFFLTENNTLNVSATADTTGLRR